MITVFGSQPRIPPPSTFARIEDWKGQGPALGRAEAARRLEEAHKLLEELGNMLGDVRRELLGRPGLPVVVPSAAAAGQGRWSASSRPVRRIVLIDG
jgi:hypothetical protein